MKQNNTTPTEIHASIKLGIDAHALCQRLDRYARGNRKAFSVVRVPTPEEERERALSRQRQQVVRERQRLQAMGRSLLAMHGFHVGGKWRKGKTWSRVRAEAPECPPAGPYPADANPTSPASGPLTTRFFPRNRRLPNGNNHSQDKPTKSTSTLDQPHSREFAFSGWPRPERHWADRRTGAREFESEPAFRGTRTSCRRRGGAPQFL